MRLPSVAEPCLGSLVSLLSCGADESTVATAIDSIRRVLQSPELPPQPRVVTGLALLLPTVPLASAPSPSDLSAVAAAHVDSWPASAGLHGPLE